MENHCWSSIIFGDMLINVTQPEVSFKNLQLPNLPLIYIASLSGIMVIWLLAVAVNKLLFVVILWPIFTNYSWNTKFLLWCGKTVFQQRMGYVLVTMALAPVTIWIFKKYFLYFTAQKDLFPVFGDKVLKRKNKIVLC